MFGKIELSRLGPNELIIIKKNASNYSSVISLGINAERDSIEIAQECGELFFKNYLNKEEFQELIDELQKLANGMIDK